ncbi:SDR family oxidoreductase [Brevibacterium sediminis]|uniref:SDR family NAD(P)-dependent oxidoreductase n=1 Tax=Brevibacterium sediminis TaxID=1857024 RepID=A0A5C4X496_9MICO|nr:SDR family oxidoreductase [Brevibacterium sediminis]TNM56119.1 SDR family NAD(P)-dependent oxidoreductase [Brevibacterium sediminis]
MKIRNSVAIVTGANRGLGKQFVAQLLERGAGRVYAAARRPEFIDLPGVDTLRLDVTDQQQVAEAARAVGQADIVINNAGFSSFARLVDGELSDIRREIEVNYFGALQMVRAFAPGMRNRGRGAFLNVSSVMAWLGFEHSNSYGASKAANWAMSNGLREELAGTGIQVSSLLLGSTDTDMMARIDVPKNPPDKLVAVALDQFEDGVNEILADDAAKTLKAELSVDRGRFVE